MSYSQFVTQRRLRRLGASGAVSGDVPVLFRYEAGQYIPYLGGTFTRASTKTVVSQGGLVTTVASGIIPDTHYINGQGPYTLPEGSRTNICLEAQTFATAPWTVSGTQAVTPNSTVAPDGTTTGDTLTAAGAGDFLYQTITFTADATKALAIYLKAGTAAVTTLMLRDDSAAAIRHRVDVTWTAGVPSPATVSGSGTIYTTTQLSGGWYRIQFSVASVVAANTNTWRIYPAQVGGGTGTVIAWGAQAENATFPSSYIPTTTVSVTRAADALSFAFLPVPQVATLYVKGVEMGTLINGTNGRLIALGDPGVNTAFYVLPSAASGNYRSTHKAGGSTVTSTAAAAPTLGQGVEVRAILYGDGSTAIGQSIASAAEAVAATSAANTLAAAWNPQTLYVNGESGAPGFFAFQSIRIAAGTQSLSTMRSL